MVAKKIALLDIDHNLAKATAQELSSKHPDVDVLPVQVEMANLFP